MRRELDILGLIPSCICGFVDLAADARRPLTAAEINDELREQIAITRRAGFPILRAQHVSPETLEGLAADAERAGVVLAVEINAPMALDSPELEQTIELFDRLQSPALGFLADFGTTARRLADGLRKAYTATGVPEEAIVLVWDHWSRHTRGSRFELRDELEAQLRAEGHGEAAIRLANQAMILFGREDPRSWRDLLRYIVHTHVKLFEADADGRDPCIAYDELLPMLLESGYEGVLSWEYEGWLWSATSPSTTDHLPAGPDVIAAHQRYVRTVLEA